ncbi:alpha/beta hydrolase [Yinghuangia sp. YIM S09857]|uniref:alpha/beta hydrolase n=1 Tax=Yinghuangia sp. YIM S09857 TaxID=3436929 RepID=UPI003F52C620
MAPFEVVHTRHVIELDSPALRPSGLHVVGDVFVPLRSSGLPVLCCLPGGGLSRKYWDLRPGGDESYSFALYAARRGFPVLTVDHLGTGESDLPPGAPPPTLGQVVQANDCAFRRLVDVVRTQLALPAQPRAVGVGHSMGAVLTLRQHAEFPRYSALALLGFTTAGLPEKLPPDLVAAAGKRPGDDVLARLTGSMFGSAYPNLGAGTSPARSASESSALDRAIADCTTPLLGVGGLLALLPGNVAHEARRVRIPVFLGNGEHDRLVNARAGAHEYPRARSVEAFVLAGSGHRQNLAPDRLRLWEALTDWASRTAPRL